MTTPRSGSAATSPSSGFPTDLFSLDFLNFPPGPGSASGSIGGLSIDSPETMMGMGGPSNALDALSTNKGGPSNQSNHANSHSRAQGLPFGGSPFDFHSSGMDGSAMAEAESSSQPFGTAQHRRDSQGGSLSMIPEMGNSGASHQPGRSTSTRGRTRKADAGKAAKRKSTGSHKAEGRESSSGNSMDIDTDPATLQAHAQALWAQSQLQSQNQNGMQGDGQEVMEYPPSGGFGVPIGMLQQLEGFHMQSPLVFDPKNAQAYSNLMPFMSEEAKNGMAQGQMPLGMHGGLMTPGPSGDMFPQFRSDGPQMSPMTLEMLARNENTEAGSSEFNLLPLLSPALHTHSQSLPSNLTSPAGDFAFNNAASYISASGDSHSGNGQSRGQSRQMTQQSGSTHHNASGSGFSSVSDLAGRSPLEALQEQQRLFQEQLTALQDQQRQLQATAAVVAAQAMQQQQSQATHLNQQHQGNSQMQTGQGQSPARGGMGVNGNINMLASSSQQTSPYIAASGASSTSAPSRPATTPGGGHMGSAEPSPSYFSPLTSPALEASARFQSFAPSHTHNGGMGRQSQYAQTFPLSALSSPALNPIGSSGGANQTLSPALNPVTDGLDDPDYVRQLLGQMENPMMMNGSNAASGPAPATGAPSQIFSPVQLAVGQSTHSHSSHTSSPLVTGQAGPGPSSAGGAGPHRQSLPAKTRPSPLIKPTHHRHRHAGNGSMPSSPLIPMFKNGAGGSVSGMGVVPGTYLPAAAVEQLAQTASTTSTPSPVDLRDLRDIMPPPPVPSKLNSQTGYVAGSTDGGGPTNGSHAHVQPMTPAALMNMGSNPAAMGVPMGRALSSGMGTVSVPLTSDSGDIRKPIERPSTANGSVNGNANGRNGNAPTAQGSGSAKMPIAPLPSKGRKAAIAPAAPSAQDGSSPGAAGSGAGARKGKGVKKGGRGGGAVGVRAAIKGAALAAAIPIPEGENRKSSHKAAEQKRRDSLKAGFDELRLLLPPINTEALDPESGEPIPGSSAPRLLPKSSLVPDDNPNRGVSKVALLKFSNEYIVKLHAKVEKRDTYIEKLRQEVARLRQGGEGEEVRMSVMVERDEVEDEDDVGLSDDDDDDGHRGLLEEEVDLLEYDVAAGEEEDEDEAEEEGDEEEGEDGLEGEDDEMGGAEDKSAAVTIPSVNGKRGRPTTGAMPPLTASTPGAGHGRRLSRVAINPNSKAKGRKSE